MRRKVLRVFCFLLKECDVLAKVGKFWGLKVEGLKVEGLKVSRSRGGGGG
jgi:hypothetical protein